MIEPPVPFPNVIARASQADIGYILYGDDRPQRRYALPRKFFERAMAGLALCIGDLPEMATLLRRHAMGIISSKCPEAMAATIDSLAAPEIKAFKRTSLAAAKELCWKRKEKALPYIDDELRPAGAP